MDMGFDNASRNLASIGVIDFDANAYIRGTKPMYVGSPEPPLQLPFDAPIGSNFSCPASFNSSFGGPRLNSQPSADAFVSHEKGSEGISLKEGLFGGLLGTLGILGLVKLLSKKKADPLIDDEAITAEATKKPSIWKRIKNLGSTAWAKVKSIGSGAGKKVKGAGSTILEKTKGLTKYEKGIIGTIIGTLTLYGLYKIFSNPQQEPPQIH